MAKKKGLISAGGQKIAIVAIVIAATAGVLLAGPLYITDFPIDVYGIAENIVPQQQLTQAQIDEMAEVGFTIPPDPGSEIPVSPNAPVENTCQDPDISEQECADDPTNATELTDEEQMMLEEMMNMTVTSDDPPIAQACDELDLGCSDTRKISLLGELTRISSQGNRTTEFFQFDLSRLSLFIDPESQIDYRTGFLELQLSMNSTDANTSLESDGSMDVLINENIIDTVPLRTTGLTDNDGGIKVDFISPGGAASDTYVFDIGANFDSFENEQINIISMIITDLSSILEPQACIAIFPTPPECLPANFGLVNQTLVTVDIFRDDIQILITDTSGNQIISYPQDDRFTLSTVARSKLGIQSCTDPTNPSAPTLSGRSGSGCSFTSFVIATYPAPTIPLSQLRDVNNVLIASNSGSGVIINELIFRNANYSVSSITDFSFMTTKSQKNYAYSCWSDQAIDYSRVTGSITNTIRPRAWDYYSPFVTGPIFTVCNFPK